jgi:hypothetical protein
MEENFEQQNQPINEAEDKEVEVLEFSLDDSEIEELIIKLVELKHMKQSFNFEVDDNNELQISYEDSEEEGEVEND